LPFVSDRARRDHVHPNRVGQQRILSALDSAELERLFIRSDFARLSRED
jgi:hypothetical protein